MQGVERFRCEWHQPPVTAELTRDGEPYRGTEGMHRYFADVQAHWRELTVNPVHLREAGDAVVALGHASGSSFAAVGPQSSGKSVAMSSGSWNGNWRHGHHRRFIRPGFAFSVGVPYAAYYDDSCYELQRVWIRGGWHVRRIYVCGDY